MRTKLSLSVLKAESVTLLDSSQVSEDHQTEIHVSYKYIMSVAGGGGKRGGTGRGEFRMGAGRRERKKTSYVSSTGKNSFDLTQ